MDQAHVVLVSSPDVRDFNHFLDLSNRLSSVLNVHVTILAVTSSSLAETETIQAAKARGTYEIKEIPSVAVKSNVRDELKSMRLKPNVMIVGYFGTDLMSITEGGVKAKYLYFPSHDSYRQTMIIGLRIPMGDGILVNIWEELQGKIVAELRDDMDLNRDVKVPVYYIGPITKSNEVLVRTENLNSIFNWLNNKRERSVVFVCLESGDERFSLEQKIELAWGLELSDQNFLWVIRSNDADDLVRDDHLPNGFFDPTRDVGRVVMGFEKAPQAEILSHKSMGGFLSDCNGDILLESLTKGVPIIAWPIYAAQSMNAKWLMEELGVAIGTSSEFQSENVIGREEVASLVKKIVEDKEIRAQADLVKLKSVLAWTRGASSLSSLLNWAKQCRLINKKNKIMSCLA